VPYIELEGGLKETGRGSIYDWEKVYKWCLEVSKRGEPILIDAVLDYCEQEFGQRPHRGQISHVFLKRYAKDEKKFVARVSITMEVEKKDGSRGIARGVGYVVGSSLEELKENFEKVKKKLAE